MVSVTPVLNPSPSSAKGIFVSLAFKAWSLPEAGGLRIQCFASLGQTGGGSGELFPVKLTVSVLCPKEGRHSCVPAVRGDTESSSTQASQWYCGGAESLWLWLFRQSILLVFKAAHCSWGVGRCGF